MKLRIKVTAVYDIEVGACPDARHVEEIMGRVITLPIRVRSDQSGYLGVRNGPAWELKLVDAAVRSHKLHLGRGQA